MTNSHVNVCLDSQHMHLPDSRQAQLKAVDRRSLKQANGLHCLLGEFVATDSPKCSCVLAQALPLLEQFEILIGLGNITAETDILAMVSEEARLLQNHPHCKPDSTPQTQKLGFRFRMAWPGLGSFGSGSIPEAGMPGGMCAWGGPGLRGTRSAAQAFSCQRGQTKLCELPDTCLRMLAG